MQKPVQMGCYFQLSSEPTVGSLIELEIHIPPEISGEPAGTLLCKGKVVGVRTQDSGRTGVSCSIEALRLLPEAADYQATEE